MPIHEMEVWKTLTSYKTCTGNMTVGALIVHVAEDQAVQYTRETAALPET
jgi:hypothetical protein